MSKLNANNEWKIEQSLTKQHTMKKL